jgi:hypothetical protein
MKSVVGALFIGVSQLAPQFVHGHHCLVPDNRFRELR